LVCVGVFGMLGLRAIAGPTSASAQGLAPAEFYREVERAYGLLGERRYPEAAESLARLVAADSQNQYLASGFAFALEQSGWCDEAIPVLERLLVLGYRTRPRVATRIAACHTRAGRRDLAFAWLDSAVALGLESRVTIATDTNFAGLRAAYWMTVLPGGRTVYVQFNQVASLGSDPLPQFAERLKRTLADSGTTSLVVDIRNNGGGNTELYPPLVGAVIHFGEGAPDARVFVIIGRHTFSAAQNFASTLQRYVRDVVFVGEPSGSRPNFVGESQPLLLPFSELRASVSSRYHQNADFTDSRQWIAPDVPASLSSADYFSGRDPALDAILELTGGRK